MSVSKGVALITGAGQGIGRAVALRLAADGFDVAVNDIASNKEKLEAVVQELKAKGRRAHYVVADVSKETEVEGMVSEVVKELGSLEVMVANAGICTMKSIFDSSAADFDRTISVNLRGTFLCYKYAGKQMVAQGRGGRIIGACSGSGKTGAPMLGAYVSSKFGIRGLTQVAAQEFGPHGITVNAYAPGPVKTQMWDDLEVVIGGPPGALEPQLAGMAALRKVAVPDDIAMLASFFASPDAHLITGQCINIDAGREYN
ncbi:NAD(P)-binding protein [Artomyces pyxidatus]|uniref:NAD(P)-binding protein n=1 Tax=Artomyces pyxidatus TaxID=48021 RepID=A0ACB8TF83_9AGAM|nr:NAD(P)-binding protein [Artomyces pyxidatus]